MKSTVLWALIVLNVVLLLSFLGRISRQSTAIAQQPTRQVGDYLAIPGRFQGVTSGVVVVIDQSTEQLSAISYDDGNRRFDWMPRIDLKPLFSANPPAPRPGNR